MLYIPGAHQLTSGGFYSRNEGGGWDTQESAKLVLHSVAASHHPQLQQLRTADGRPLADVVDAGLAAGEDEAAASVDAALTLLETLQNSTEVQIKVNFESGVEGVTLTKALPHRFQSWSS